jgi:hypothetical protein
MFLVHIVVKTHKKNQLPHDQICKYIAYWFEKDYKFALGEPMVVCFDNADAGYSNSVN